ncbi:MAG: AraC family transcriptional regulator [Abditibacteriaceae bacterium]
MNKWRRTKEKVKTSSLNIFAARVLSVGYIELKPHQWLLPKSTSKFWSIYIPDNKGLLLGYGKDEVEVPVGSLGLVPSGASAARDNTESLSAIFLHFDIGGFAGLSLENQINQIVIIPSNIFQSQISAIKEGDSTGSSLFQQMSAQAFLAEVLVEALSNTNRSDKPYSEDSPAVQKILSVLHVIEERLNSPTFVPLKVDDMAQMCGMKSVVFSRIFFEVIGKNPADYTLNRKIAVAVQRLLFTNKSIDDITLSFAFANRFYFSRVFKEKVGVTPAVYRSAFHSKE